MYCIKPALSRSRFSPYVRIISIMPYILPALLLASHRIGRFFELGALKQKLKNGPREKISGESAEMSFAVLPTDFRPLSGNIGMFIEYSKNISLDYFLSGSRLFPENLGEFCQP